MSASQIRSRAMVTHAIDRHRWNEITDGAVLQEDGAIVEIGTYRDLSRRHPNVPGRCRPSARGRSSARRGLDQSRQCAPARARGADELPNRNIQRHLGNAGVASIR